MPFKDKEEYKRGHKAEVLVAEELKARGWYVIPSYDYSGDGDDKAPKMRGAARGFVLPDLDAARKGVRRWVEVKAKASVNETRKTGKKEHGIPRHHYFDYLDVQQETGNVVYLAVYEENTGAILCARLDTLTMRTCLCRACRNTKKTEHYVRGCTMSPTGMVFFLRDEFVAMESCNNLASRPERRASRGSTGTVATG